MGNFLKTGLLLGLLTGLIMMIGGLVGGQRGVMFAFILAAAMNFFSYWFSDKMVLAAYGAKPLDEANAPELSCCNPIWITRSDFLAAAWHWSASATDHVIVFSQ